MKVVPAPSWVLTSMVPPALCTMRWLMARPRPGALVLGGVERHEEVLQDLLRDAGAAVGDAELDPAPTCPTERAAAERTRVPTTTLPRPVHGLDGVADRFIST